MLMSKVMKGNPSDYPMTQFFRGKEPEQRFGLPNYWVNTANLNLVIMDRISFYKGLGPAIQFTLTYNSQSRDRGQFGFGWSFSFESSLQERGDQILLKKGSGQSLRFRTGRPPGTGIEGRPVEATDLSGTGDRLLDYGTHWLYLPKGARLSCRYMRTPGKNTLQLHSISDFDGNVVTLDYSLNGVIQGITDAAGRTTRFESSSGLCTGFVLPDGKRSSFLYDKSGHLISVNDLEGIPVRYEYNSSGLLTLMEVGKDRKRTVFHYNVSTLSAITDAGGHSTRYQMEKGVVRITDPLGNTITYSNINGKTVKITNSLGESEIFEYERGHRVGHKDGKADGSRMTFDAAGNPAQYTSPNGERTTFTYDQYGNLTGETTPLGNTFAFSFDARHHLTGVRSPTGSEMRFSYDPKGQLVSMTDQNNNTTTFTYDRFGNVAEMEDPEGGQIRFSFDPSGITLQSVTDARGNTTRYEFDGNRHLTRITHPDGTQVRHVFGCCARLSTIDENGKETKILRDPLLSITERIDGDKNSFRYRYDPCRRLIQSVDPRGQATDFTYDAAGRLIRVTYPTGESSRVEYASGRTPGRITNENGHAITYMHDSNGSLIRETDQAGAMTSITRDPLGRISGFVNGKSQHISYQYDPEGHPVGKQINGKTVASYRYDPAGNLLEMNDESGTTTYRYNRIHKITSISFSGNHEITCTYDKGGNITSILYPGGLLVKYQYDVRNRPVNVSFATHEIGIGYDNAGNLLSESRSNGTRSTYRYDARQRIIEAMHVKGSSSLAMVSSARDPSGNICEQMGRIPVSGGIRQNSITASYSPLNQVETWNGDRYRYDPDGNLTGIEGARSFAGVYDAFNHLTDLYTDGIHRKFLHNGKGQRVQRILNDQSRRYLYGPTGDLLAEIDEAQKVISCYVYCQGRLLARISEGKPLFYHADTCGHIICLTDEHGDVSASYNYDPFGYIIAKSGSPADNQPFTYCGLYGVMNEGGGLYFMKRRYYDSVTGRFIQKDPIGILGGLNVYTYSGNNPVSYSDPEGLIAPVIAAGLILFGMAGAGLAMRHNRSYNTINNVLSGANEYISAPHAPGAYDNFMNKISNIGNIPEAIKEDFFDGQRALWDKFLSLHPASWETHWGEYGLSNVYSGVKAVYDTVTGEYIPAVRNWAETIPSWPGQLANGINNWIDAYSGDQDKMCK
jgi:RHS repeat-associated protein